MKIVLKSETWSKMMAWTNAVDTEISWMGLVSHKEGVFSVLDVFLPEQRCHSATTEMEADSLAKMETDLITADRIGDGENQGYLSWWCHTHPNMSTNPSGQDEKQLREFSEDGWILASIFNKKGENTNMFMENIQNVGGLSGPVEIYHKNVVLEVVSHLPKSMVDGWKADAKKAVLGTPGAQYKGNVNCPPFATGAGGNVFDKHGQFYNHNHKKEGFSKKPGSDTSRSVAKHPHYKFIHRLIASPFDFYKVQQKDKTVHKTVPGHWHNGLWISSYTGNFADPKYMKAFRLWDESYEKLTQFFKDNSMLGMAKIYCIEKNYHCITRLHKTDEAKILDWFQHDAWDDPIMSIEEFDRLAQEEIQLALENAHGIY